MPRIAGQIDRAKAEAALEAASEVMAEQGLAAPLQLIAKRAGVSKQTLYNHYGGKTGLFRAQISRAVAQMTAPFVEPSPSEPVEDSLAGLAADMMRWVLAPPAIAAKKRAIEGASDMPELPATLDEGSKAVISRIAAYFQAQTEAGRLQVDDPQEAAEFFDALVRRREPAMLSGLEGELDEATVQARSAAIARHFVRAYRVRKG